MISADDQDDGTQQRPSALDRRRLLGTLGLSGLGALGLGGLGLGLGNPGLASGTQEAGAPQPRDIVRPPRLRRGDRVGLVNPASAERETTPTDILIEALESLDLVPVVGEHFFERRGYFAGNDQQRAADFNRFVLDPDIRAILANGGWGSARLLPLLDYDALRADPKILLGFSDVTALLLGVHARTGLVTFHGPLPRNRFSAEHQRQVVFAPNTPTLSNPREIKPDDLAQREDRIQTLTPGRARGRLLGGNLTVLSAIVGSDYLPDWSGCILFLEDVREAPYRVDRMLTQLSLAGILEQAAGFVFGHCTDCRPGDGFGSLSLEQILEDHIVPLGIPAYRGAMIGHIARQFTIPLGVEAEIDAGEGTIRLLEPAVT